MKLLSACISGFDGLLLIFLSRDEIRNRKEEFESEFASYDSNPTKMIYDAYGSIDTKATAILQHVSIMIAVSGLLFSQTTSSGFRWIFGIEMILYVLLALFCLRLFMEQYHASQFSDSENVVVREALLDVTAKLTFLVSIFLVLTVIAELVMR